MGRVLQRISESLFLLRYKETLFAHVWMNTQNFVVLGKGMAFCVNIGGIDLQKYFIDKQCLYPVAARI